MRVNEAREPQKFGQWARKMLSSALCALLLNPRSFKSPNIRIWIQQTYCQETHAVELSKKSMFTNISGRFVSLHFPSMISAENSRRSKSCRFWFSIAVRALSVEYAHPAPSHGHFDGSYALSPTTDMFTAVVGNDDYLHPILTHLVSYADYHYCIIIIQCVVGDISILLIPLHASYHDGRSEANWNLYEILHQDHLWCLWCPVVFCELILFLRH